MGERSLIVLWVVGLILHGGPIELFLVTAANKMCYKIESTLANIFLIFNIWYVISVIFNFIINPHKNFTCE